MTRSAGPLDNFTDAAFAFAVNLLVIGGAGGPSDFNAKRCDWTGGKAEE
jgi:hypothetical protein